ncbi:MAG TPA: M56 family metallopeptidase [Tepidisphaeraceae bacterium]|nr:M56 family metallopeptidase [Tepidisphaeraceae bacterium]
MNLALNLADQPMVAQLGWTVVHSLWQGLAIAILLRLLLTLPLRLSAQARYVASCLALAAMALLPIATFSIMARSAQRGSPVAQQAQKTSNPMLGSRDPPPSASQGGSLSMVVRETIEPLTARPLPAPANRIASPAKPSHIFSIALFRRWLSAAVPWIALVWCVGVVLMSLWNIGGWIAIQRLKIEQTTPVSAEIESQIARLARRLGIARAVRVVQCIAIDSPLVIGVIKPVILVPASILTDLPVAQIEALFAHELAHIIRQDYLINLIQTLIETLLFFNPAAWWVSSRIRIEREHCCDDLAMSVTRDRAAYVKALAWVGGASAPTLAPAASGGELLPRLRRVLAQPDADARRGSRWLAGSLALVACVVAVLIFSARRVTAQNAPARAADLATTQPAQSDALTRSVKVIGSVLDDVNGRPIRHFRIVKGWTWTSGSDRVVWEDSKNDREIYGAGGRFELVEDVKREGYAVRIDADGYLPAESPVFHPGDATVSLSFRLKRLPDIEGTLIKSDGTPLVNANLLIVTPACQIFLQDGKVGSQTMVPIDKPDANGHFDLGPQDGKYFLMVVSDEGYALLRPEDLGASKRITIPPWGRIEGKASIGSAPAAGQVIWAYGFIPSEGAHPGRMDDFMSVRMEEHVTIDSKGNFVIPRAPMGPAVVGIQVIWGDAKRPEQIGATQRVTVEVAPGKTNEVVLGGSGRPITGRVITPPNLADQLDWYGGRFEIRTRLHLPGRVLPADWKTLTDQQRFAWNEQWRKTPEVVAYEKELAKRKYYPVVVHPDGTFRVDDIVAGDYVLYIEPYVPRGPNGWVNTRGVASASLEFTVPQMPTGRSDEPLDIGAVLLKPKKALPASQAAPLTAKTVDGKPLSLAQFKGKYVLVDFWATWCAPCVAEMPYLKATYDAYSNDPRFAMISLSVDEKPEAPAQFAVNQGLKWTQGFLGDWSSNDIAAQWDVHAIPSVFLIGPDGKIIDRDLRGDAIKRRVGAALKAP